MLTDNEHVTPLPPFPIQTLEMLSFSSFSITKPSFGGGGGGGGKQDALWSMESSEWEWLRTLYEGLGHYMRSYMRYLTSKFAFSIVMTK